MGKSLLAIFVLLFSSLSYGNISFSNIKWKSLSEVQRIVVISIFREHLLLTEELNSEVSAALRWKLIKEAYAVEYNCLIAGWPSQKSPSGSCQTPVKININYDHYLGCSENELLCNPALFGDGLCISFKTTKEKNSAFSQCEKLFSEDERSFADVLEDVNENEFNELVSTVNMVCRSESKIRPLCLKLKKRLQYFVEDETPQGANELKQALNGGDIAKISAAARKLQREMEEDIQGFTIECKEPIPTELRIRCKNLASQVLKSKEMLDKVYKKMESQTSGDCINCSMQTEKVISPLETKLNALQCTAIEKKNKFNDCDKEVLCSIGSTVFSSFVAVKEIIKRRPDACLSSQNDCVTNLVTALVDSVISMVTGLWDLLGMAVNWAGEVASDFWKMLWRIEDKTADAQHVLGNMTDEEVKEVKTNPIEWVKNFASNIWKGITQWIKEDIFCQKWSGVPRASECLVPMKEFGCLDCRTIIAGTCSAGGVIIAEIVPALLTGGAINLVGRASSGASEFVNVIKSSQSYKKTAEKVDQLSEIKAIKATGEILSTVKRGLDKTTQSLINSYKALTNSSGLKGTLRVMEKAAKYSGVKAFAHANIRAYEIGNSLIDNIIPKKTINISKTPRRKHDIIMNKIAKNQKIMEKGHAELRPSYEDVYRAHEKGQAYRELNRELSILSRNDASNPRIVELQEKISVTRNEILEINNRYINRMHAIYVKEGIPSKIVSGKEGDLILELDFASIPTERRALNFYRQVKKKFEIDQVTISLKTNAENSADGFFRASEKRMELGPNQAASLLEEYVSSNGKHESRHSMFFAKRNRGESSIFHSEFNASSHGKLLNVKQIYDNFMTVEELYTHSTDLQSLAKGFKGERVSNKEMKSSLIAQIADKNDNLIVVANTSKELSQKMGQSINNLIEQKKGLPGMRVLPDNSVEIYFTDDLNRVGTITLVSPQEKELLNGIMKITEAKDGALNNFIGHGLKNKGHDVEELGKRWPDKLTDKERADIDNIVSNFNNSPEGISFQTSINEASAPVLNYALDRYEKIARLSEIQLVEAQKLSNLLKAEADIANIEAIRAQMFMMGKNVKEDYKGFALNK